MAGLKVLMLCPPIGGSWARSVSRESYGEGLSRRSAKQRGKRAELAPRRRARRSAVLYLPAARRRTTNNEAFCGSDSGSGVGSCATLPPSARCAVP
nr:hypothetical protein CFP56_00339 [Quercus suber]